MRTAARTLAIAAFLLAALVATEDATPAEAKVGPTILSGGDLPHAISIPFEDSFPLWFPPRAAANMDTFPGWPFRLDTPPATRGPAMTCPVPSKLGWCRITTVQTPCGQT